LNGLALTGESGFLGALSEGIGRQEAREEKYPHRVSIGGALQNFTGWPCNPATHRWRLS